MSRNPAKNKAYGHHEEQLERLEPHFDEGQVLVLCSAALFASPRDSLNKGLGFLGVDRSFTFNNLTPRNVGTNTDEAHRSVYEQLDSYFAPPNAQLFERIERKSSRHYSS